MLKNKGYAGSYRNENISVGVLLENPAEHNLDAADLVFSVTLKDKDGGILPPEDFTFYIMNESNQFYNTRIVAHSNTTAETSADILICTDFEFDFLFQDLRIVFYHTPYKHINIIELQH